MTAEIQVKDLRKSYQDGTEALKGVDLEITKGRLFALLGPNGAGKSTLLKILTTLIKKSSGDFLIDGINPETNFSKIQRHIGVASQENELDPSETVESLLVFQGRLFGMTKEASTERCRELLSLFQLESERSKKTGNLSGGNKRRLHCALALVHKPKLLFLDEPTVGMDPMARHTFWNVISGLKSNEGLTIFLTTQYLEEAEKYASEMSIIINGSIHFTGSVSEFKKEVNPDEKASLEDSYLLFLKSYSNDKKAKEYE